MRMEPSTFSTRSVTSASTSYSCTTLSSSGSMANAFCENKAMKAAARVKPARLFIAQRHHRIDLHGAPRGKIARKSRGYHQQSDYAGIRHDIGSADAIEHGPEHAGQTDRGENSHGHAAQNQREALPENHAQHVDTLGA